MATIVLQAAGGFLGGMFGPVGAVVGRAAGALAGYAVDQAVINGMRRLEGPRLNDPRPFTAEDGAALPRIYGSVRVNGTLIWATRFEEETTSERAGAKGGPKVTNYTYSPISPLRCARGRLRACGASGWTGVSWTRRSTRSAGIAVMTRRSRIT